MGTARSAKRRACVASEKVAGQLSFASRSQAKWNLHLSSKLDLLRCRPSALNGHTRVRMKPRGAPTLSGPTAACLAAVLATWFLVPSAGRCAQPSREPPVKLPPVVVIATAPLVKIGEFEMREERYQPAAVAQGDFIY